MLPIEVMTGFIILIVTYYLIASERIHRAVAAMIGVSLTIIALKVFNKSLETIFEHVDLNTIILLLSMMMTVTIMEKAGLFEVISWKIMSMSHGSVFLLMFLLSILTGILSAFLDNVTTVLIVGPITLEITKHAKLDPRPFIFSEIFSSNIGGTSTLIGDPPNIIIGTQAHLTFNDFLYNTGPISFFLLLTTPIIMYLLFKGDLESKQISEKILEKIPHEPKNIRLFRESIFVLFLIISLFLTEEYHHIPSSLIALLGASLLLAISRVSATEVIRAVEWPTIVFFIMLFMVIGGVTELGVIDFIALEISKVHLNTYQISLIILWISMFASAFVDNIPYVATMVPTIEKLNAILGIKTNVLYWALSLGGCYGGNGTPIGASANVVLLSLTDRSGCHITWREYLKYGMIVLMITGLVSSIYLLRYL